MWKVKKYKIDEIIILVKILTQTVMYIAPELGLKCTW